VTEPTDYLRVSYSSLGTFSSCARRFEFDKLYPKRDRGDEDWYAADVGSALHAGFQGYLTHRDDERAVWEFMQAFPYEGEFMQTNDYRGFEASLATLESMFMEARLAEYDLAQIRRPLNQLEIAANLEHGMHLDSSKDVKLPFDPRGVVVPAIEVPFEIRFKGLTLPDGRGLSFIGYIDAVMQNQMTGLFRTLDIKTSRMSVKDATGKYKFDTQQIPYGIVVDHVAQGAVDAFEVLYLDCYIDLLEPRVTLYPFMKTQADIQEWCVNKVLQFENLKRYMASNYFPRTDNGCLFYNKPCRYLEPCMSRDRESLVEWFLMGEEPKADRPFEPWIIADIEVE